MRAYGVTWMGVAAIALAACGPGGPSSLEGFGDETGDGDGDPSGDGDGDPTGDGDGEPSECIDTHAGSETSIFIEGELSGSSGNDVADHCGGGSIGDHAVSWIAPESGVYRLNLFADFFGWVTVLDGSCNGSLFGCSDPFGAPLEFEAFAGQQYTFAVEGESSGWFGLAVSLLDVNPLPCPTGQLVDVPVTVSGSTVGSGNDFGTTCGGFDAPDREWLFFPPITGTYRIRTMNSSYDPLIGVFVGECNPNAELICNDDGFDGLEAAVDVQLSSAQVYTIVVDGWGESSGNYNLDIQLLGSPGFCNGAEPLPPGGPLEIAWPGDMSSSDDYHNCSMASAEKRFLWSAPEGGDWIVRFFGEGAVGLTILEDCQAGGATCSFGSNGIDLQLAAQPGKQYVIVTEWELNGGSVELQIESVAEAGCGDSLGSSVPLVFADSTIGSGDDHEGSCTVNPVAERELNWTAPATGTYRFSLEGSSYDTLMYIRDGGCDGVELGCNDDTFTPQGLQLWSLLELDLQSGQTVSIFVDGYSGTGEFNLEITAI